MRRALPLSVLLPLLVTSCAELRKNPFPKITFNKPDYTNAPAWAGTSATQEWWRSLSDNRLSTLINEARANNPDLTILALRLEKAREQIKQAEARAKPSLVVSTGYQLGSQRFMFIDDSMSSNPWRSSADAAWELDFFGRVRTGIRAAKRFADAAFWDKRAGEIAITTETADAWFRILRLNGELSLISDSATANRAILDILRARQKAGLISGIELERQIGENERLERLVLDVKREQTNAILVLENLLGREAGGMSPPSGDLNSVRIPKTPVVLPPELLRRRPDLLAAEARLRASWDVEEQARLDLLPRLTLTGNASGESDSLLSQFQSWSAIIGPNLEIPVYDPARLSRRRASTLDTLESAEDYRKAVLAAFSEIETAYNNYQNRLQQISFADREVAALERARQLTREKLDAGVVSQLELLESERRHLDAQRERISLRQSLFSDWLSLIKALGG
jgi:NodT family efflux transporter outer membrane factor (OMF) lipoprotein